jgi:hypothetical protein
MLVLNLVQTSLGLKIVSDACWATLSLCGKTLMWQKYGGNAVTGPGGGSEDMARTW